MNGRLRSNYLLGIYNGITFQIGFHLMDATLLLPLFYSNLTSSQVVIGLAGAISFAGSSLPQAFIARYIHCLHQRLPFYLKIGWVRVTCLMLATLGVFLYPVFGSKTLLLIQTMVCLAGYEISSGFSSLAFLEIVRTSMPATHRGRLWGYRRFWGGLTILALTPAVQFVMKTLSFPFNFAIFFSATTCLTAAGILIISKAREMPRQPPEIPSGSYAFILQTLRLMMKRREYVLLFFMQLLVNTWVMTLPFYIIFTKAELSVPVVLVAYFLAFQLVGKISSNLVWASINDRMGSFSIYRYAPIPAAVAAGLAAFMPVQGYWLPVLIGASFFLIGMAKNGFDIGFTNITLDLADRHGSTVSIGIMNTLNSVLSILPVAGGVLITWLGYRSAFGISMAAVLLMIPASIRMIRGTRNGETRPVKGERAVPAAGVLSAR